MIQTEALTKVFGSNVAVDHLSVTVFPGLVTGFLGPNGAGKSTTMRLMVGLDRATSGRALVNGQAYRKLRDPLAQVGVLLDAKAVHPGRSARSHLRAMAATQGIGRRRVEEMIELTGLGSVASRRVGKFSLGMHQRLGIAAALLGDPAVLILDEPVNGLDPEGVAWVRQLARGMAAQGRTVLISSHLMSEMAQTADRVIIIGRGRLIADTSVADLIARTSGQTSLVRSPQASQLFEALTRQGAKVKTQAEGTLIVDGWPTAAIGDLAAAEGLTLHQLTSQTSTLEAAYMEITRGAVEFRSGLPGGGAR
ncbi:MAG: ATP-binding cassette domain-containing protein [Micrococcales bacterium]|nr:ATP-binding cassette domain-containing protein [Micrococcales bacterium]